MKIQCVLNREGGTKAEIDGIEYHFEPLADGAHVADVEREDHIDRFLGIPEGYKVYHGKGEPKGKPVEVGPVTAPAAKTEAPATNTLPLAGSEQHPPQFDIGGTVYTQRDVVEKAFAASGLTSDEWNDLGDDERAAKIDIMLDELADAHDGQEANDQGGKTAPVDEAASREALVELYKAKFGKAPHYRASVEKIKTELEA